MEFDSSDDLGFSQIDGVATEFIGLNGWWTKQGFNPSGVGGWERAIKLGPPPSTNSTSTISHLLPDDASHLHLTIFR